MHHQTPGTYILAQSPIRVATLAPADESERLFAFMQELSQSVRPLERTDYLPDWPGFNTVFDMRVTAAVKKCRVELDGSFENEMAQSAMHLVRWLDRAPPRHRARDDAERLMKALARGLKLDHGSSVTIGPHA